MFSKLFIWSGVVDKIETNLKYSLGITGHLSTTEWERVLHMSSLQEILTILTMNESIIQDPPTRIYLVNGNGLCRGEFI